MKLDLGSGHVRIKGWERVDLDPEADADYKIAIQDVENHFKRNTVDKIRAYHVLEHISPKEVFPTLRGWWKVLKPEGTVTIEVPNCEYAIHAYADEDISWSEVERIILGADQDATEWMVHRCLFTPKKLQRFFMITGFVDIVLNDSKEEVVNMTAKKPFELPIKKAKTDNKI